MRFYEFAPAAKPVLKISQPQANTPATPWPANTTATPTVPEPVKVHPRNWQHDWMERYLAAQMAKDAQTVKPTELDIVRAYMRFSDARRKAEQEYQKQRQSQKSRPRPQILGDLVGKVG